MIQNKCIGDDTKAAAARGMKKIDRYLAISEKHTRYSHSYYRMWIGNLTHAFEWYHFQRPWTTPNLDIKVTRTHASIWCWISRKRPTEGCHFEWSWVISSDLLEYLTSRSIERSLCDRELLVIVRRPCSMFLAPNTWPSVAVRSVQLQLVCGTVCQR